MASLTIPNILDLWKSSDRWRSRRAYKIKFPFRSWKCRRIEILDGWLQRENNFKRSSIKSAIHVQIKWDLVLRNWKDNFKQRWISFNVVIQRSRCRPQNIPLERWLDHSRPSFKLSFLRKLVYRRGSSRKRAQRKMETNVNIGYLSNNCWQMFVYVTQWRIHY
jgi:hypothetical protein